MSPIKSSTARQDIRTLLWRIVSSPVTQFNLLFVGVLVFIGIIHQMAHNDIETDVHGYCYNLERTK